MYANVDFDGLKPVVDSGLKVLVVKIITHWSYDVDGFGSIGSKRTDLTCC